MSTQVAVSGVGSSSSKIRNPGAVAAAAKAAPNQASSSSASGSGSGKGTAVLGGVAGIVRCRRCAREAVFEDSRADVWEDGDGRRFLGGDNVTVVAVPGVLRYLDVELAAMGIRMKFWVDN